MAKAAPVAIVDDDKAMRKLTARYLERAGYGSEGFADGDAFLSGSGPRRFGCVLLDLRMPGRDGLAVLRALQERQPSQPVIVITGHGAIKTAVEAMKLGAADFLEKPFSEADLIAAIGKAATGHADARARAAAGDAARANLETLSPRQRQVLCGMVLGDANKMIAYRLGLSIRTVEAYRAQLLDKLEVRNSAGAIRIALAAGMDCSQYDAMTR